LHHELAIRCLYQHLTLVATFNVRTCAIQRHLAAIFRNAADLQVRHFFAA